MERRLQSEALTLYCGSLYRGRVNFVLMSGSREIPLLTDEECSEFAARVHAAQEDWIRRDPARPFWTLGTASYLDAAESGFDEYARRAQSTNPQICQAFDALHRKVMSALADATGESVRMEPRLAVPGFHVIGGHPDYTKEFASAHFDRQYTLIEWSAEDAVDIDRQLSFTLPLQLPRNGAGLTVWNVDWLSVRNKEGDWKESAREALASPREIRYSRGTLVLHGGHLLHRIAPMVDPQPDDFRITLQGHLIRGDSGWIVYW